MDDRTPETDDIEPGWAGLAILLWPVGAYFKVKAWVRNHIAHR